MVCACSRDAYPEAIQYLEEAKEVTATGTPVLRRYGVSDEDAFAVGLTCGGIIDVYVERVDRAAAGASQDSGPDPHITAPPT